MVKLPIGVMPPEIKKGYYHADDTPLLELENISSYYDKQFNYFFVFGTDGASVMLYGIVTWRPEWNNNKDPELNAVIMKNISLVATDITGNMRFSSPHMYFRVWPIME